MKEIGLYYAKEGMKEIRLYTMLKRESRFLGSAKEGMTDIGLYSAQ